MMIHTNTATCTSKTSSSTTTSSTKSNYNPRFHQLGTQYLMIPEQELQEYYYKLKLQITVTFFKIRDMKMNLSKLPGTTRNKTHETPRRPNTTE